MARVPDCRRWVRICPPSCTTAPPSSWPAAATRAPAKAYGIYPQKGTIAVGSDADLAIVDLDLEREVRAEDLRGMSDFSPFEHKKLRGWPVATIKAGEIIARDGKIVGKRNGHYLPRTPKNAPPDVEWLPRNS